MRRRVIRVPREDSVGPSTVQNGSGAPPLPESQVKPGEGRLRAVDLGLFDRRKQVVVGIDQSLAAFGLVAFSPEDETAFAWLYEPANFGVRRLMSIRFFVHSTIQQITLRCGEPEHVTMESYAYSRQMGHALGECGAATKMALINALGIAREVAYPSIVSIQQVKKFTTNNGNATKSQMLLAVYKKWGVTFADDNLADAYALARVAAALATGETKFDYEQDVIRRIARNTEWELQSKTARSTSSTKGKRASSG
jgi:Holliday junction resolvasome RuvABC endonuclease subunit